MTVTDETTLVKRTQSGDLKAYDALMRLHVRRLRGFVALRVPVSHLIDEISHETFVYAYRHIGDFKAGTNFGAWLRAIAGNLVRQEVQRYARTEANREKYLEHVVVQTAAANATEDSTDTMSHLRSCVGELPEHLSSLVQMRYGDAANSDDIAAAMGRSSAWVRTTLFRTRQELRKCIERKLGDECPVLVGQGA